MHHQVPLSKASGVVKSIHDVPCNTHTMHLISKLMAHAHHLTHPNILGALFVLPGERLTRLRGRVSSDNGAWGRGENVVATS
jgi:hypothetical protein